jgi:hypothetical protein
MWKNTASPGELPGENLVRAPVHLDIRELREAAFREPLRLVVHERARHQPRTPVRAGDEFDSRRAVYRVDGQPHRAVLYALDVVVRLVLVPWGRLAGARLLDQQVVVEESNLPGAHQLAGDRSGRGAAHELLVLRDPLPVAEVLEESAGVVRPACHERPLARLGEVALDPTLDERDLVGGKRAAHAHGAVPSKMLDSRRRHPPIACGKRKSRSGSKRRFTSTSLA